MNWKSWIRTLTGWRMKNERRTVKNGGKSSQIYSWKRLGSVAEAPQLGFSLRKHIFSPKTAEKHSQEVWNILKQPPSPIYREKGGACRPEASWGRFISASQSLSSPPFSYFTEKLWKPYGSVSDLIFIFFSLPFCQCVSEICLPMVFGNFREALWKPRKPFFNNVKELAAQLLPP